MANTEDVKSKSKKPVHHVMIFGASSGIAMEFAKPLAEKKARFTLIARDEEKLRDISADLYARGATEVAVVAYGLNSLEGSYQGTAAILQQTELPDTVLIAHSILGDNEHLLGSPQDMNELFQVNVLSPIGILMALEGPMAARGKGTIAVISSVAGDRGRASNFAYGSTKAAVTAYTSGFRARMALRGVQVLTIKPGMVATAMTAHLPPSPLMARPQTVAKDIIRAIGDKANVLYTPWFWRWIMQVIVHLPEFVFKKLKF